MGKKVKRNDQPAFHLTLDERSLLRFMAMGLDHRQVAYRMKISVKAVGGLIRQICRKMPSNEHFRNVIQAKLLDGILENEEG